MPHRFTNSNFASTHSHPPAADARPPRRTTKGPRSPVITTAADARMPMTREGIVRVDSVAGEGVPAATHQPVQPAYCASMLSEELT